jgi:hypothetical protein
MSITVPLFENKVEGELGISAISIRLGRCEICIFNALKECMKENPNWFTPKTKKVSLCHQDNVLDYIHGKVKEKQSIGIEKEICCEGDDNESEYTCYCKEHFLRAVNDLIVKESL